MSVPSSDSLALALPRHNTFVRVTGFKALFSGLADFGEEGVSGKGKGKGKGGEGESEGGSEKKKKKGVAGKRMGGDS